jgi:hypothetical protein
MRPQSRNIAKLKPKKKFGYVEWRKKFWAYFRAGENTNAALLGLIKVLGSKGKQELALSIYNFLRPQLWMKLRQNRRQTGQHVDKRLAKVIRDLNKLAKNYRALRDLAPELGPCTVLGAAAPQGFADCLEAEAIRLIGQQELTKIAFNYKRGGNKSDLANLIRLQYLVDEFARRSGNSFPEGAARHLKASDLADLLEAGKAAFDLPEDDTITDAATILRALQRFRKHPQNRIISALLKQDAVNACEKLFGGPSVPSSNPSKQPDTKSSKI